MITQPRNTQEQWLVDIVRRQAEKLNIKTPDVAIYQAPDMNAFATGARRDNSLVAVSTAMLSTMTRDEAEAVIAHEMSHVANGDMVTMTLLQGVLNTFVIFISRILASVVAQAMAEQNRGASQMVYFLIVMLFEVVFGVLASLIAMWLSRRREFYADAGSANIPIGAIINAKPKLIIIDINLKIRNNNAGNAMEMPVPPNKKDLIDSIIYLEYGNKNRFSIILDTMDILRPPGRKYIEIMTITTPKVKFFM